MNSKTFHKTPLSFWLLLAAAVVIAELCFIYLSRQGSTSRYLQPGQAYGTDQVQYTAQY